MINASLSCPPFFYSFFLPVAVYSDELTGTPPEETKETVEAIGYISDNSILFKLRSTLDRSLSDEIANTGLSSVAAGIVGKVFGISWTGIINLILNLNDYGGLSNTVFFNFTVSAICTGAALGVFSILARTYFKKPSDLLIRPFVWGLYKFLLAKDFIFYQEYPTELDDKHRSFLKPVAEKLTSLVEIIFNIPANYWDINLMSADKPDTFSFAGYKIGIGRSFFPIAKNHAGLACILGHEMGHVLAKRNGQSFTDLLFLNKTALASIPFTNAIAHNQEHHADEIGLYLMVLAGYDPSECSRVWERVISATGDERAIIRIFLNNHPTNASRLEALKKLGIQLKGYYASKPETLGLGMEYEL